MKIPLIYYGTWDRNDLRCRWLGLTNSWIAVWFEWVKVQVQERLRGFLVLLKILILKLPVMPCEASNYKQISSRNFKVVIRKGFFICAFTCGEVTLISGKPPSNRLMICSWGISLLGVTLGGGGFGGPILSWQWHVVGIQLFKPSSHFETCVSLPC